MSEELDEWGLYKGEFSDLKNFIDIFLITYSGQIRRTTVPLSIMSFFAYLERPDSDIEPGYLDEIFCKEADRQKCGYSEAALNFLTKMRAETKTGQQYYDLMENEEAWKKLEDEYCAEMLSRARIWREKHDMWEVDLPPSFD